MLRIRGNIVLEAQVWENAELTCDKGTIVELTPTAFHARHTFYFPDALISPGLIDTHIHGARSYDVMDGTDEAMIQLTHYLVSQGTTSFLPTTMSGTHAKILRALSAVTQAIHAPIPLPARILGVHMEGPFLNPARCGAQDPDVLREPDLTEMAEYLQAASIRIMTVAPELPGFDALQTWLTRQGVIVSFGHTGMTFDQALYTINTLGVHHVTHLFNGMAPMHHREPGPAGAALFSPSVICELICDGIHVHPAWIRWLNQVKPGQIVLVTDAMRATGLGDGTYDLGGQTVTVDRSVARTASGSLAGSTLSLLNAVYNFHRFTGCTWPEAIAAASLIPAKLLQLNHRLGSLTVGKAADVIIFDPIKGQNLLTLVDGRVVWTADENGNRWQRDEG